MSHLSLETLARLVEDAPNTDESAHLESCAECRAELDALNEDVHALRMLPDMAAAPDQWAALERRLTDEGLIRTRAGRFTGIVPLTRGAAATRSLGAAPVPGAAATRMLQIAAALVLFLGGSLAGRMTLEPRIDTVTQYVPVEVPGATVMQPQPQLAAEDAGGAASLPAAPMRTPQVNPAVALAAHVASAGTVEEAAAVLRDAEDVYLGALTRYAELAAQAQAGDPVARLAALQSIIMTTQAALNQTPTDPVINGYHLTALAQRDATLRQVAAASSDRWY